MKINVTDFETGARNASGITIVIDVFRAFSVACYLSFGNASKIICVGAVEDAWKHKQRIPDAILIGERGGKKLRNFDFGNSPSEIKEQNFSGKTVIHTTHAGTQGLVSVSNSTEILTGSFLNARATAAYINLQSPAEVTLVRMGLQAETRSDEDDLCAEYLEALLTGGRFEVDSVKNSLRQSPCSARFFDAEKPWSPATDFDLCLDVDRFDFALRAIRQSDGTVCLEQV